MKGSINTCAREENVYKSNTITLRKIMPHMNSRGNVQTYLIKRQGDFTKGTCGAKFSQEEFYKTSREFYDISRTNFL